MMTIAPARIAVAVSYAAVSLAGTGFLFSYWASESIASAAGRSILFVIIMANVHLAGYLLYVEQGLPRRSEAASAPRASFEFAPQYWPAIKDAMILQLVFGVLTALMLDSGRSFEFFEVAFAGHWIGILIIVGRRPLSPTKADILFIRWGVLVLLLATGLVSPFIWSIMGQSHLSGWQRLWD